jgi:hypothetical protein
MSFIFAFRRKRSTRGARGHGPGDTVRVRKAATFMIVEFGVSRRGMTKTTEDDEDDGSCGQI